MSKSVNLALDAIQPAADGAIVRRVDDAVHVIGLRPQWAYAAAASLGTSVISGPIRLEVKVTVLVGQVSAGILAAGGERFLTEKRVTAINQETSLFLDVEDAADAAAVVLRTFEDCGRPPEMIVHGLTVSSHPYEPEYVLEPGVDPMVESLWPLPLPDYSVNRLRKWDDAMLRANLTGDPLQDNLVLNKWEFAHGVTVLKSLPWRLSIPFVLCNARCDFCAAWLMKGNAALDDLMTSLIPVIRHSYELDLVGWGEPLIHPQFDHILEILKKEADPRARLALTTNGTVLDEWIDRLLEANVMAYAISVHATNSRTHQDLMGLGPDDFDRVIAATKALVRRKADYSKLDVEMVMVMTRQNFAEVPAFIAMCEELGVDRIHFRTLMPQENPREGLDYHRLPPYLHPEFESLQAAAVAAISESRLRIKAAPDTWSRPVFSREWEPQLDTLPLTRREERGYIRLAEIKWEELGGGELSAAPEHEHVPENIYGRGAPLYCPSPYTAFYANGFDRRVIPCVYMHKVPGHEFMHLKPSFTFDQVWNSPAMVAVRKSLNEGPLMSTCLKCPFFC
jgi:MoaA/NifB/PqqE/SkfB family radical SAM enzyme